MAERVEELMATCSKKCLEDSLREKGLGSSGNKKKLASKLAMWEMKKNNVDQSKIDLEEFLSPTLATTNDSKPTVTQYYSDHFSLVDRFNKLVSQISFRPRCSPEHIRLFVSLVEIAIVETFVLFYDTNQTKDVVFRSKFGKELALELMTN